VWSLNNAAYRFTRRLINKRLPLLIVACEQHDMNSWSVQSVAGFKVLKDVKGLGSRFGELRDFCGTVVATEAPAIRDEARTVYTYGAVTLAP